MATARVIAFFTLALTVLGSLVSEAAGEGLGRTAGLSAGGSHAWARGSEEAVGRLKQQGLYDALTAAVEETRYRAGKRPATRSEPEAYEVANPAQRLSASFAAGGVEMRAAGGRAGWRVGMRLSAWGRSERLEELSDALIVASGNRVEYRHRDAAGLTEWYVNMPRGIEQGFTLARPPAEGGQGAPLTLMVEVNGDLAPRLDAAGNAIQLVGADGTPVLRYAELRAWDATDRTLPSRMEVKAGRVRLLVDDTSAVYPVTVDPLVFSETKLAAGDGAANDDYGASVAISGDTVVVGAPDHATDGKASAGQAYVYVRSGTVWSEQAKLKASDGSASDAFGSSVAISGDTIVVGAPFAPFSTTDTGQVYVYVRSGTTWSEQAKLTASDGVTGDEFGDSVAISGDTVVVGAPLRSPGDQILVGQAYVYVRSGTTWSEQAKLTASDAADIDEFGSSVAISGDTAVVGAPGHDLDAGQGYVYVRSVAVWSEQAKLVASDGAASDAFATSVAISGDTVVVGAPDHTTDMKGLAGQAYVYVRSGTTWSEQAKLKASDGALGDSFGDSVAISGEAVVVGAPFSDTGQAYVYVRSGTTWSEQAKLTASDAASGDFFGGSVAISGDTGVVGALFHNSSTGQAYVFAPDVTPPETMITAGPSGTIATRTAVFSWTGSDDVTATGSLVYAFRLHPLELTFSPFGSATTKTYTGLNNGAYTFFVKARDQAGNKDLTPASRSFTVSAPSRLVALGPAKVWVGRGSLASGIRFDLRAEVYVQGPPPAAATLAGSGQVNSVAGGSGTSFFGANLTSIPLALISGPATIPAGGKLKLRVLARNACTGSAQPSGIARLWFNGHAVDTGLGRDAGSRFGATIRGTARTYFLRNLFALNTTAGNLRASVDAAVGAKCGPFVQFGTWRIIIP